VRDEQVADFDLDDEWGEAIRHAAADGRPVLEWFETRIVDDEGGLVARCVKQVYVRRRPG
jgi:hypothetical protein